MEFLKQQELQKLLEFIAFRDAMIVYKACAGLGTDDDLLISLLCQRTKTQINEIDRYSRTLHQISLKERIENECGGNYKKFLLFLCESRQEYFGRQLKEAMSGMGCDKSLVNEVICLGTKTELEVTKAYYEQTFNESLSDKLRSELSGEHEILIMNLLLKGRGDRPLDLQLAKEQAEKIYNIIENGGGMMGGLKDNAQRELSTILYEASSAQCLAIKRAWETKYIHEDSLEKTFKSKLTGSMEEACLLLIKDPIDACCEKLKKAFDGLGTDEDALSRIIGGVDKRDAAIIAERYQAKYNENLVDRIKDEVGGNYAQSMVTWITATDVTRGVEFDLKNTSPRSDEHERLVVKALENAKLSVAELDAELLIYAAKGLGTDERLVVQILCARTKEQLDGIDQVMLAKHNRSLKQYIEKEMGGNLERFLTYCQLSEEEFDAELLKKAFSGLGCDKSLVLEVICTRSYERLLAARTYYEAHYDANLMDRLRSELSGPLERLAINLFARPRERESSGPLNDEAVARELYEMGAGRFGTHEESFVDIFSSHSVEDMKKIAAAYDRMFGTSLVAAVKSEFSSYIKEALLNLLEDPIDVYCRKLKSASVDTIGTDEATVCRIIGGNNKAMVRTIAARYFEKYNSVLIEDLRSELSGDFREAVLTYINSNDITGGLEELIKQAQTSFSEMKKEQAAAPPPIRMDAESAAPKVANVPPSNPNTPPETCSGWGIKEGHIWKSWKRRFLILESNSSSTTLKYYVEEGGGSGQDMKGEINVRGYSVTTKNVENGTALYLKGRNEEDKDLTVIIDGAHDREKWINAINAHVAYRKHMDDQARARQVRDF